MLEGMAIAGGAALHQIFRFAPYRGVSVLVCGFLWSRMNDGWLNCSRQGLSEDGVVTVAPDGRDSLAFAETGGFDLLILDGMLPRCTGFDVARQLRSRGDRMPILMLTARDAPRDVINGLDLGADDYINKPFSFEILLARIRALGRRGPISQPVLLGKSWSFGASGHARSPAGRQKRSTSRARNTRSSNC
jgi:DNA-binding response OmpR family regulator